MAAMIFAFLLAAGAAPGEAATPRKDDPAKIRCKREVETGSLARVRKTCRTIAEWETIRRDAFDQTTRMQGTGVSNAPGGAGGGG